MGSTEVSLENDIERICKWNGPPLPPQDQLLHHLIEDQVRRDPDASAICSWDGDLTYRQLDDLANALAVELRTKGVTVETIVPLCFTKSKYMIVAMLAVLKADGAFCPLEPGQPETITSTIIGNVGAALCICSETCKDLMRRVAPKQSLLVLNESYVAALAPGDRVASRAQGHNAAYCFFTSGSTGIPKGCINEHAACCVSFREQARAMRLHSKSRLLHRASFCFDAFLCETVDGLVAGGCICIPREADFQTKPTQTIAAFQANWALFLPSFLGQLDRKAIPCLTTVVLGVEVMSAYHIAEWTQQANVQNAYGLTELAVVSTVASDVVTGSNPRNIGVPIGVHGWIVDPNDHNKLVSIGSMGELALSGPALGRGYLNDKKQTDQAYVESPSWMPEQYRQVEPRLFKTGDLVRYDDDGSIVCIGRKANLTTYKGTPIVMHEVEYFLQSAMPSANQFVAEIMDLEAAGGQPTLIAFVALRQDQQGKAVQVSREDGEKLAQLTKGKLPDDIKSVSPYPDACWPAVFVPCFPLPKKWSGKANRLVLREAAATLSAEQLENFSRGFKQGRAFNVESGSKWPWILAS